jgi:hypothetical protein
MKFLLSEGRRWPDPQRVLSELDFQLVGDKQFILCPLLFQQQQMQQVELEMEAGVKI